MVRASGDVLVRLEEADAARDVLELGADRAAAQQLQRDRKAEPDARILPLFLPRHARQHATSGKLAGIHQNGGKGRCVLSMGAS